MATTKATASQRDGISPKITFYTNRSCPWAHRAAIVLKELDLPHDEVTIPLDRPRDEWYLKINPRGLVPAIKISTGVLEDEIITESATVATFLADLFPRSSFYPPSHESPTSALTRARIGFFVDTWFTKVNTLAYPTLAAEGQEEKTENAQKLVDAVKKEIEPLLEGTGPFFGGSESLTLAEALVAPFAIRYKTYAEAGLFPIEVQKQLDSLPNYGKWSKALFAQESVTYIYDEAEIANAARRRIAKMKAK